MFAPCSHAGGLLEWLEAVLPPLPFAMCFSAAEERPDGILALPNGFLKTLVAKRYGEELAGYAGLEVERIEYIALPIPAPLRRVLPPRVSRIVTRLDVVGSRLGPLFGKQFVVAARKYQRPA